MLQYTNSFSCATSPLKEEVIINFGQQMPSYGQDGNVVGVKMEDVVTLAMGRTTAERLVASLVELLDEHK